MVDGIHGRIRCGHEQRAACHHRDPSHKTRHRGRGRCRYLGSGLLTSFEPSTQAFRCAILERFRVEHGEKRIGKLLPEHVARLIGGLRPYAQRNMIKTLRSLIAFSITEGLITADPTVGVKLSKAKDTGGFPTWPMECIEQYRAAHKLGTRRGLRWNCCTEGCRGAVTW